MSIPLAQTLNPRISRPIDSRNLNAMKKDRERVAGAAISNNFPATRASTDLPFLRIVRPSKPTFDIVGQVLVRMVKRGCVVQEFDDPCVDLLANHNSDSLLTFN
jgi:hypothetical protein